MLQSHLIGRFGTCSRVVFDHGRDDVRGWHPLRSTAVNSGPRARRGGLSGKLFHARLPALRQVKQQYFRLVLGYDGQQHFFAHRRAIPR
jgi:hypothetical protein